jgi:hypothetical protein
VVAGSFTPPPPGPATILEDSRATYETAT